MLLLISDEHKMNGKACLYRKRGTWVKGRVNIPVFMFNYSRGKSFLLECDCVRNRDGNYEEKT